MKENILTQEEKITIDYYETHAAEWKVNHQQLGTFGRLEPEFKIFFKLLSKGKVIEIGAGTGEDAVNLIKKYGVGNYIGLEPARGLRQIAIGNNPGAKFIDASIYDINFPKNEFDGFWLCQVLIHIPKRRISEVLRSVSSVIRPKGIGMISILEGNADMEESRPGRYYSLWTDGQFLDVLKENGFTVIHKRKIETGSSPWLVYIVRRKK